MKKKDSLGREKEVHFYCHICLTGYPTYTSADIHKTLTHHTLQVVTIKVK